MNDQFIFLKRSALFCRFVSLFWEMMGDTLLFLFQSVKFFYSPRWRQSAAGIPIGPNSSSPASTKSILHLYTTPAVGYEIPTEQETLYVHLLFSLKDRDLGMMEANFASLIYYAFQFLEANWQDLVSDVARGILKESLAVPPEVRTKLNLLLKPDENRAEELRKEFSKGLLTWLVSLPPIFLPYLQNFFIFFFWIFFINFLFLYSFHFIFIFEIKFLYHILIFYYFIIFYFILFFSFYFFHFFFFI